MLVKQELDIQKLSPGPWAIVVLLLGITLSFLILINSGIGSSLNETESILVSTGLALVFWIIAQRVYTVTKYGIGFVVTLNVIFLLKIVLNLAHFYYFFAPAAGISSSAELLRAKFTGDSPSIYNATLIFAKMAETKGLWFAIAGDYYRDINNLGVAIIYGILYVTFGPYASAAIPWSSLAMGVASLQLCSIGYSFGFSDKLIKNVMVLLFLMPVFFITPPNYRDQFMIFLSISIVYISIYAALKNNVNSLLPLVVLTPFVASLRTAYLLLPFVSTFVAFYSYRKLDVNRSTAKFVFLCAVMIITTIVLAYMFSSRLEEMNSRVGTNDYSDMGPFGKLKAMGGIFYYLGVIPYSLLAPFPWWQDVEVSLMVYQIFNYPQTWFGLTMIFAVFFNRQPNELAKAFFPFKATALFMFILAIAGSKNLGWSYIQIIIPLLVLSAAPVLEKRRFFYMSMAGSVILVMHIAYFIFKM